MPDSVAASWARIEMWLRQNAPHISEMLHVGATVSEIADLESTLGVKLPSDMKDSLAVHRGADYNAMIFPSSELHGGKAFSPMEFEQIAQDWKMWKELIAAGEFEGKTSQPENGIRNDWWNINWIPFAHNTAGDYQCVDLVPTKSGTIGQIIGAWHDEDERQLISSSLGQYLSDLASELESGALVYREDDGIVSKQYDELHGPPMVYTRPKRETAPCPYCGKPLRSLIAKQCRFCKMDWHDPDNVFCRK